MRHPPGFSKRKWKTRSGEKRWAYLDRAKTIRVATTNEDGSIYLSPLWHVVEDEHLPVVDLAERLHERGEGLHQCEELLLGGGGPLGDLPKLTKRQQEVWNVIEEWRELPLQELLGLAQTTPDTVRKLEDKGLVSLGPKISERDPYANEHILPTQPLGLNSDQAAALRRIPRAARRTRNCGREL